MLGHSNATEITALLPIGLRFPSEDQQWDTAVGLELTTVTSASARGWELCPGWSQQLSDPGCLPYSFLPNLFLNFSFAVLARQTNVASS